MDTKITQWGNSLAVRIPKSVAQRARMQKGDRLALRVARPGIVEIRVSRPKPTLAALVRQITPENLHQETRWGAPRGNEVW